MGEIVTSSIEYSAYYKHIIYYLFNVYKNV